MGVNVLGVNLCEPLGTPRDGIVKEHTRAGPRSPCTYVADAQFGLLARFPTTGAGIYPNSIACLKILFP